MRACRCTSALFTLIALALVVLTPKAAWASWPGVGNQWMAGDIPDPFNGRTITATPGGDFSDVMVRTVRQDIRDMNLIAVESGAQDIRFGTMTWDAIDQTKALAQTMKAGQPLQPVEAWMNCVNGCRFMQNEAAKRGLTLTAHNRTNLVRGRDVGIHAFSVALVRLSDGSVGIRYFDATLSQEHFRGGHGVGVLEGDPTFRRLMPGGTLFESAPDIAARQRQIVETIYQRGWVDMSFPEFQEHMNEWGGLRKEFSTPESLVARQTLDGHTNRAVNVEAPVPEHLNQKTLRAQAHAHTQANRPTFFGRLFRR